MKHLFLLALALGFCLENAAQKQASLPTSGIALHANRLRIDQLVPGGIDWPRLPNTLSVDHDRVPVTVDFDGTPKASTGVEFSGFWLGGKDSSGQLRVSCSEFYHPFDFPFTAGPLSGDWPTDSLNAIRWDRFFKVDRVSLEIQRADWADNGSLDNPLPAIVGWPGRGNPHFENQYGFTLPDGDLAPFVDVNGDGFYNAFNGDYPHPPSLDPDILVGEIIWNVFNDAYGRFTDQPLGVEIHTTAWALACDGDNLLNETAFFSHKVINRSGLDLDSVVAGIWIYPNLGASFRDHWGTHVSSNSIFIYNEDNVDELINNTYKASFGENPPAVSFTSLNHPLYKTMYYVTGVVCDAFSLYGPVSPTEYYRFLNGAWKWGNPLTYGDRGNDIFGSPTDFAFPGDPNDPISWSMLNTSFPCAIKFALGSFHIGQLPKDTSFTLEFAYAYHRGEGLNYLENVTNCFDRTTQLQQLYDSKFAGACTYTTDICTDDCVWPGDFDRDGIVNLRDLLPLGVGWETQGLKRSGLVTWAPHAAPDWDISFNNEYDYKHLDASGDGFVDSVDFNINQVFYGLTKPDFSPAPDTYEIGDALWLTHSYSLSDPDNINSGNLASILTAVGDADELYGLAFEMEYDTNYWKFFSLNSAISPTTLKVVKRRGGIVENAHVFTNQISVFSPLQNLFRIILRAKAIPDSLPDTTFVYLKNIKGISADGSEIPMGANRLRYCFGGGCPAYVGTQELPQENISVFPNPSTGRVTFIAPDLSWENIEAFDMNGRLLRRWDTPGSEQIELELAGFSPGWVLLRVTGKDWTGQQKVLFLK